MQAALSPLGGYVTLPHMLDEGRTTITGEFICEPLSSAKFALRGLVQSLARELWPQSVHVAHVVVDGIIGPAGSAQQVSRPSMAKRSSIRITWRNLVGISQTSFDRLDVGAGFASAT